MEQQECHKVFSWNLANSEREERNHPLKKRLQSVCDFLEAINEDQLEFACFQEMRGTLNMDANAVLRKIRKSLPQMSFAISHVRNSRRNPMLRLTMWDESKYILLNVIDHRIGHSLIQECEFFSKEFSTTLTLLNVHAPMKPKELKFAYWETVALILEHSTATARIAIGDFNTFTEERFHFNNIFGIRKNPLVASLGEEHLTFISFDGDFNEKGERYKSCLDNTVSDKFLETRIYAPENQASWPSDHAPIVSFFSCF